MNNRKHFIYKNIYSYDIPACHYNILKSSDYDISHIDKDNKFERNKAIGIMMRDDPELTKMLRSTTKEIVDFYISNNLLSPSDVILRQYDGFYSTKSLNLNLVHNYPASLEFKNLYDIFIFSINKKMYLGLDCHNDELLIKGIPSRYDEVDALYKKMLNINFMDVRSIITSLQKFKKTIYTNDKIKFYMIPVKDKFKIFLSDLGEVNFNKKTVKMIDVEDIDREKYFQLYFEPFFKSIIYEIF
jgi:hypothetical protein